MYRRAENLLVYLDGTNFWKPNLSSQKCQGFPFSTTPAFYESIFGLFHWDILSLSLVDDSACDFVVRSHGYLCKVSSVFFPQGSNLFCFLVLKITFACDFVDNLICQKFCGMFCKAPQSRPLP